MQPDDTQPLSSEEGIDPAALSLLEGALDRALSDQATRKEIEELAARGVEIDSTQIREEIMGAPMAVFRPAGAMLTGWQEQEARLDKVRSALRRAIKTFLNIRVITGGALIAAAGYLFLSSELRYIPAVLVALALATLVYVGSLLDFTTVRVRRRARDEAKMRLVEALNAQAIVAVREAVNRRLISFSTNFRIFDRRGLRQLADPDREVPTAAIGELKDLIASLDSGSIGLSGPRGCGKTTVIRSFTDGRTMPFSEELVGLTVAAPVKYDAREFVLHLFASLCERVLRSRPDDLAQSGSRWEYARRRRTMWTLLLAAITLGAAGLTFLINPTLPGREAVGIAALALSGFCAYIWLIFWVETTSWGMKLNRFLVRLFRIELDGRAARRSAERVAKGYLKQIRFQQSQAAERSAGLSLFGLSLGGSSTTTLARTPWTLPEAVEEFRRFVSALSGRYVVIGIDELDKMESDEAAREFLNNVKGVFGVQGCYFLVSVSEDAMSAFERRGLPLRDVFDSSFDEIQRVGYLGLEETLMVLGGRVTGLPVPFQCLCHCLAGGLPRDLIRVTRGLVDHYDRAMDGKPASAEVSLSALTSSLITSEWRGKVAGAIAAERSAQQPWWLSSWLHEIAEKKLDEQMLQSRTMELGETPYLFEPSSLKEDPTKAQRIGVEMVALNYYTATILSFFEGDDKNEMLNSAEQPTELDSRGAEIVETLAKARQQFSVNPWLTWGLVARARETACLPQWDDLRPAAERKSPSLLKRAGAVFHLGDAAATL